jgi:CRP/FNR family transcriptional regulator, cyclic AMP receptor protein
MDISTKTDQFERVNALNALARKGWLSTQPQDFRVAMVELGRSRKLARGEAIALEDDDDARMYAITSGSIAACGSHAHHAPVLGTILFPGQWFGFGPLLAGTRRVLRFHAQEHSLLLCYGNAELERAHLFFPDLPTRLTQLALLQLNYATDIVGELLVENTILRIVTVIQRLAIWAAPTTRLPLSQAELAEMCNASRASVSTVLKQLERNGLAVPHYGGIEVLDLDALNRWNVPGGDRA